jgi:hypothetical protein
LGVRSKTADAAAIRRLMARIRRNRHEEVRKVFAGAESVAGLGRHPGALAIAALSAVAAAAAAAVYVTAGNRRGDGAMESTELVSGQSTAGRRAMSSLAVFLGRVAARAAQNYVGHCLDDWMTPPRRAAGASSLHDQADHCLSCQAPGGSDEGPQNVRPRSA